MPSRAETIKNTLSVFKHAETTSRAYHCKHHRNLFISHRITGRAEESQTDMRLLTIQISCRQRFRREEESKIN